MDERKGEVVGSVSHPVKHSVTGLKTKSFTLVCFIITLCIYVVFNESTYISRFQALLLLLYSFRVYADHFSAKLITFMLWGLSTLILFTCIVGSTATVYYRSRTVNVGLPYKLVHYALWIASQRWSARFSALLCSLIDLTSHITLYPELRMQFADFHLTQLFISIPAIFIFVKATIRRVIVCVIIVYVYAFVLLDNREPIVFFISFVFARGFVRPVLIMFWLCVSLTFTLLAYLFRPPRLSKTECRKFYHFAASIVVTSGLLFDPALIRVALCVAIFAIEIAEACRYHKAFLVGDLVNFIFNPFMTNSEHPEMAELSPITLLLGLSYPLLFQRTSLMGEAATSKDRMPLCTYAGVLSTGIGDSLASVVGTRFGRTHWPRRKRTIEGSISNFIGQIVSALMLLLVGRQWTVLTSIRSVVLIVAGICVSVLFEAFSRADDNLFGAVVIYPFLRLASHNLRC